LNLNLLEISGTFLYGEDDAKAKQRKSDYEKYRSQQYERKPFDRERDCVVPENVNARNLELQGYGLYARADQTAGDGAMAGKRHRFVDRIRMP
jgi:hypothetical protein